MAEKNSAIPTIDVLPPMSRRARDIMYGVLAWAAGLVTIANIVIASVPQWSLSDELLVVNAVINGLWTLGGFKAKKNVPPPEEVENVDGRHEAGETTQGIVLWAVVVILMVLFILWVF